MTQGSSVRKTCRDFVEAHSAGYDASHDISHIDRVVLNAIRILELSDEKTKQVIDENVLIAIASMHDCFDHKYLTTADSVSKAKSDVRSFLADTLDMDTATINMVIDVIDSMGFTSEVTQGSTDGNIKHPSRDTYLHIAQDADRLDAIGAIGVSRCLAFSGAFSRPIVTPDASEERSQRRAYSTGSLTATARKGPSAISHFYDKLVFLKDMLKTPAGQSIGEQRHQFILSFLDQFFNEIGE